MSETKDDTNDIKHLVLKESLAKCLGRLSLVCFVIRVYCHPHILSGSHQPLGLVAHKHHSKRNTSLLCLGQKL